MEIINRYRDKIHTAIVLNCSLAKAELGWQPYTNFPEGLKKTLDWKKQSLMEEKAGSETV